MGTVSQKRIDFLQGEGQGGGGGEEERVYSGIRRFGASRYAPGGFLA